MPTTRTAIPGSTVKAPWESDLPGYGAATLTDGLFSVILEANEDAIPPWSIWPWRRDRELRRSWKREPIMAGAVYSMHARLKSMSSQIIAEGPRTKKRFQNLLYMCDSGNGFASLIS